MVRRTAVIAVCFLALAGCAEDRATNGDPDRELSLARDRLLKAGTGSFEVTATQGAAGSIGTVDRGSYDLTAGTWEQFHTRTSSDGDVDSATTTHFLTVDETTLMRVESPSDDEGWPCWVPAQAVAGQAERVGDVTLAPAVVAASGAIGADRSAAGITGSVGLAAAAQLFSSMASFPDLDPSARTPADFMIDDGVLTGIDVRAGDLFTALAENGAFPNMSAADAGDAVGGISIRFTDTGGGVDLVAPAPATVIDPSDGRDLATAMAACGEQ